MKTKIIITLLTLLLIAGAGMKTIHNRYKKEKAERERLEGNQSVLLSDISTYKAKNGEIITRTEALIQTESELKRYNTELLAEVKNLRVRVKDLQSHISITTETTLEKTVVLRDTLLLPYVKSFEYKDEYTTIKGALTKDSVKLSYHSTDSIQVFQHIEKHSFLFIRWGVKNEWWDIKNSNPHTTIKGFEVTKIIH